MNKLFDLIMGAVCIGASIGCIIAIKDTFALWAKIIILMNAAITMLVGVVSVHDWWIYKDDDKPIKQAEV